MNTYILVHGAFHGAWCWYKLIPILQSKGHTVIANDLPGHGRRYRSNDICSLQSYTESVCKSIDQATSPVILVGHSLGGMIISQAAEWRATKIKQLIYVAAFLPKNGQCARDISIPQANNALYGHVIWSEDRMYATLPDNHFGNAFAHNASAQDKALGGLMSLPEPMTPPTEKVQLNDSQFGSVKRTYIECSEDQAMPQALQQKMYNASPCDNIIVMAKAPHSPMLSDAETLAKHIISV
jgi:pimeloyl-ACP methyl ester carboxylesterase